jgi:hypothetical protein
MFILQFGKNLCSQSVYFNNRYYFNEPDIWSGAHNLVEVEDGYIIAGTTGDTANYYWHRIAIMKLGYAGNKIWVKTYGDTISRYYDSYQGSLHKTINNCFFLSGVKQYYEPITYNTSILFKFNSNWDTLWTKEFFGDNILPIDTSMSFYQMKTCENNDLIFVGSLYFYGLQSKMLLLKTDSSGNEHWRKAYVYSGNTINTGYSVIQTTDSGFAIGGFKYTPGQPVTGDPIVIKTDSMGNQQWIKNLGGPIKDNKAMLCLDYDGNILVGTNYGDEMSGDDVFSRINIIKLDNEGNILWNKKYGESVLHNYLSNIRVLENQDVIATGSKYVGEPWRAGWVIKLNADGDSLWYREYLLLQYSINKLRDIIPTSDNGFLACGYVSPLSPDTGTQDAWVIKLDSIGCDTPGCDTTVTIPEIAYKNTENELYIYPNPVRSVLNIEYPITNNECRSIISIYDIFGRKEKEIKVPKGQQQLSVDVSNWHNGLYVAVLKNNKKFITKQKFVVLR